MLHSAHNVNLMSDVFPDASNDQRATTLITTDNFNAQSQPKGPHSRSSQRPSSTSKAGMLGHDMAASSSPASAGLGSKRSKLPPLQQAPQVNGNSKSGGGALSADIDAGSQYQTSHHALIPRMRNKSAWVQRHGGGAHAQPGGSNGSTNAGAAGKGHTALRAAAVAAATAGLREAARAAAPPPWATGGDGAVGGVPGPGGWGGASSIGDLEALDSILDHLVVLDARMRGALLRGPPISFETVVPEPRAAGGHVTTFPDEPARDRTFHLTSVGLVEEGQAGAGEEEGGFGEGRGEGEGRRPLSAPLDPLPHLSDAGGGFNPAMTGSLPSTTANISAIPEAPLSRPRWAPDRAAPAAATRGGSGTLADEVALLRAAIPTPILPKLARMYITSKQTTAAKAAPPPPPTADWLLRTRPAHPAAALAPSYDELCGQIRDVQRQYTCGTTRERAPVGGPPEPGRPPRLQPASALDVYISGIDGPTLEEVVASGMDWGLGGLERSRPSFVSMARAKSSGRRRRSRSRSPGRWAGGAGAGAQGLAGAGAGPGGVSWQEEYGAGAGEAHTAPFVQQQQPPLYAQQGQQQQGGAQGGHVVIPTSASGLGQHLPPAGEPTLSQLSQSALPPVGEEGEEEGAPPPPPDAPPAEADSAEAAVLEVDVGEEASLVALPDAPGEGGPPGEGEAGREGVAGDVDGGEGELPEGRGSPEAPGQQGEGGDDGEGAGEADEGGAAGEEGVEEGGYSGRGSTPGQESVGAAGSLPTTPGTGDGRASDAPSSAHTAPTPETGDGDDDGEEEEQEEGEDDE